MNHLPVMATVLEAVTVTGSPVELADTHVIMLQGIASYLAR